MPEEMVIDGVGRLYRIENYTTKSGNECKRYYIDDIVAYKFQEDEGLKDLHEGMTVQYFCTIKENGLTILNACWCVEEVNNDISEYDES